MGVESYRHVQKTAELPRDTEYRLFAQVTAALLSAQAEKLQGAALVDALDWNRRVWSALSTDCGQPGNGLPLAVRAQIISLGLWVSRYSSDVARGTASMDALIDVNRAIMDGLKIHQQAA
jgi:flagellar biosynthesis activator protein FlaF